MSYLRPLPDRVKALDELRATVWRLIVVFSLALAVALASRATLGPSLF